jgi:phosphoribosylanthranilate isomerase
MTTLAKICGLSTPDAVDAALEGGAAFIGFVFFAKSPRNLAPEAAARLAEPARGRAQVVAVTVDPADSELDAITATLGPDLIQLHGRETPQRLQQIKARTGAGAIKALPVSTAADLDRASAYEGVADYLMFDARPPAGSELPGGVGARFDWDLLRGRSFTTPWFLAGGLSPDNISEAVRRSGASLVDVSSGVETAPGLKDPRLISAFLAAVRSA